MNIRNNGSRHAFPRAAALGIVAGLRSQAPLAILAGGAQAGHLDRAESGIVAALARPVVSVVLILSAAGEAVVDKLPIVPDRLQAGPLGGRMFFGALAGSLLCRDRRASVVAGAALGAVGAVVGSFAGYHARGYVTDITGLPGAVVAAGEDALALGLGIVATRRVA